MNNYGQKEILEMFAKPALIGIVGDVNNAKSNLIYHIIESLESQGDFNLYTFGLRTENGTQIFSVEELERIENSVIILDEVMTLWDLDNRKAKKSIENTLRLINHNNNIMVIAMLPENCKKFISGKIDYWLFKQCTIPDFVNGTVAKQRVNNYKGYERGETLLRLGKGEALIFNGHYKKIEVPYLAQYDSKAKNQPIIREREAELKKPKLKQAK